MGFLNSLYRNITKNKFYSFINITGLAIGIACALLIALYVQDELQYDSFYKNNKRIYRLETHYILPDKEEKIAATALPLAPTLKSELPEIESFVRMKPAGTLLIQSEEEKYYEDSLSYADSTFFEIFSVKLLKGDPDNALDQPLSIVISNSLARKYFGNNDPMGKFLQIQNKKAYKITGIMEDLPENLHYRFNGLISFNSVAGAIGDSAFYTRKSEAFWNVMCYSYILLKNDADINDVITRFPALYEKYMAQVGKVINAKFLLMATRLDKIHHYTKLQWDQPTGDIAYMYIFSAIALFIILIASINYMNMATSRSAARAREVGIRKVAGAYRSQLIGQFIGESVGTTMLALIIAIGLIELLIPVFNDISGKNLNLNFLSNSFLLLTMLVLTIFIGVLSGSYPSLYLSSFQPSEVLKGKIKTGKASSLLRRFLVIFQFTVSIIMIIGTLTVSSQLDYLKTKDLGFEKENIMYTLLRDSLLRKKVPEFRNSLLKNPNIISVATSNNIPGYEYGKSLMRVESDKKMKEIVLGWGYIDDHYLQLMKFKLIAGKSFDQIEPADLKKSFIINETAALQLGWGNKALGKKIHWGLDAEGKPERDGTVVGVIQDFHYNTLQHPIEAVFLVHNPKPQGVLSIRILAKDHLKTIEFIKETWNAYLPKFPFNFVYLDNYLNKQYTKEEKLDKLFRYFSIVCIFIAFLGLFGLASYVSEQRTREFVIRKVIGASDRNILFMLYLYFTVLIVISSLIAIPIAYIIMKKWLESFAYHTEISAWPFVIAILAAFLVAIVTVSFHAIKAARTNPVQTLKYE